MNDTTMSGNIGGDFGGGIWNEGTLALSNSTLTGNTAPLGGGIDNDGTLLTVNNSTITGNSSFEGGGLYNGGDNATVSNSTLSNNSAGGGGTLTSLGGGGIFNDSGSISMANSILAGNTATTPTTSPSDCYGTASPAISDGGHNVADDNTCTLGSTSIENSSTIGLGALAANGSSGPQTQAISGTSSAFGEVPSIACTASTDERGEARPGASYPNCDAGAFELQGVPGISLASSTSSLGYGAPGQLIPYSYLVSNVGTSLLVAVSVTDSLVPVVVCPSDSLAPGTSETCTGTYPVTQSDLDAGSLTSTATASATDPNNAPVTSSPSVLTVISADCNPPVITSPTSATTAVGATFGFTVTTCTTSTPTIKASGLPKGLTLRDNRNGTATISGTPNAGDFGPYTVTVSAAVKTETTTTEHLSITVDDSGVFSSKPKDLAHTGASFSYPITTRYAYPAPTISTSSTLPDGVTLTDNGNGTATLGGTPGASAGGIYTIDLSASNGLADQSSQLFTLTIYQEPEIEAPTSDTITAGIAMTPLNVIVTGYPAPKLKATGLPSGLHLVGVNGTGTISGITKSTARGVYDITISASGKSGSASQPFVLSVNSTTEDAIGCLLSVCVRSPDINGDGLVNCADLAILSSEFGESGSDLSADINGDGGVNVSDLSLLASHWSTGQPTTC